MCTVHERGSGRSSVLAAYALPYTLGQCRAFLLIQKAYLL